MTSSMPKSALNKGLFLASHSPATDRNPNLSTIQEFPPQALLLQIQNFSLVPIPMKEQDK